MKTPKIYSYERKLLEQKGLLKPDSDVAGGGGINAAVLEAALVRALKPIREDIEALKTQLSAGGVPQLEAPKSGSTGGDDSDDNPENLLPEDQLRLLKGEIRALQHAIDETKHEVAQLYKSDSDKDRINLLKDELHQITKDTEQATSDILDRVEKVDESASQLIAQATDDHTRHLAEGIQETVTQIFELCNFQDLTGQRITKVVNTLIYIEEKIASIIEIWGEEDLDDYEVDINGVPLKGQDGLDRMINQSRDIVDKVDQDFVDSLFD